MEEKKKSKSRAESEYEDLFGDGRTVIVFGDNKESKSDSPAFAPVEPPIAPSTEPPSTAEVKPRAVSTQASAAVPKPEEPKKKLEDQPLYKLKGIVLSLEWEISEKLIDDYISETAILFDKYQHRKITQYFLKMLNSAGKYIKKRMEDVHPDTMRILISIYNNFERIFYNEDMPEAEKKQILLEEVEAYSRLKEKIVSYRSGRCEPVREGRKVVIPPAAEKDKDEEQLFGQKPETAADSPVRKVQDEEPKSLSGAAAAPGPAHALAEAVFEVKEEEGIEFKPEYAVSIHPREEKPAVPDERAASAVVAGEIEFRPEFEADTVKIEPAIGLKSAEYASLPVAGEEARVAEENKVDIESGQAVEFDIKFDEQDVSGKPECVEDDVFADSGTVFDESCADEGAVDVDEITAIPTEEKSTEVFFDDAEEQVVFIKEKSRLKPGEEAFAVRDAPRQGGEKRDVPQCELCRKMIEEAMLDIKKMIGKEFAAIRAELEDIVKGRK